LATLFRADLHRRLGAGGIAAIQLAIGFDANKVGADRARDADFIGADGLAVLDPGHKRAIRRALHPACSGLNITGD
jgi:hypothetical protein